MDDLTYMTCPTCKGKGYVESVQVIELSWGISQTEPIECNFCEGSGKILREGEDKE